MNPSSLIPAPDAIPVASVWLEVLLVITFAVHMLFINTVLGASVIAFVHGLGKKGESAMLAHTLSQKIPTVMALAVNFGVAPLLFLQMLYGQFFYSSSILMGWYWLAVIGLALAAYYSLYYYNLKYNALGARRTLVIGLAVAILVVTAFIFSNNTTLMLRPDQWGRYFETPGGTLLNLSDVGLYPRYAHFLLSCLAVGGLFTALSGTYTRQPMENDPRVVLGMRWFFWATLLQLGVGGWYLMALPRDVMLLFMGKNIVATVFFMAGLALSLAALVFGFLQRVKPTTVALICTVGCMVMLRDVVRKAYVAPYFTTQDLHVTGQYGGMVMFLACLAISLLVMWYVLRLAVNAGKEG